MTEQERLKRLIVGLKAQADSWKTYPTPSYANTCDSCGEGYTGTTSFCRPCLRLAAKTLERVGELEEALKATMPNVEALLVNFGFEVPTPCRMQAERSLERARKALNSPTDGGR